MDKPVLIRFLAWLKDHDYAICVLDPEEDCPYTYFRASDLVDEFISADQSVGKSV
jgi:hypothetical protein